MSGSSQPSFAEPEIPVEFEIWESRYYDAVAADSDVDSADSAGMNQRYVEAYVHPDEEEESPI